MKYRIRRFKILICQPHTAECIIIQNIDTTSPIHEHFSELVSPNLRGYHQGQMTWIIYPGRVILSAPQNRLLRPAQILRYCRLNRVDYSFAKLLITFAQTSSEDMILPAVQLFGIALITRLLLLLLTPLMVVTSLVALVPLIDVSGLVSLKP